MHRFKSSSLFSLLTATWVATCSAQSVFFDSVRVFDGQDNLGITNVLIADGRIVARGKSIDEPPVTTRIDGRGLTLLPGLIDSHVHVQSPDNLVQAAFFGVTFALDMGGPPELARIYRREQQLGRASERADILSAGFPVTIKGGHGTQYGFEVPVLASAESAQAFVDARIAEESDYIKIAYGGGFLPVMSKEMMAASIRAAHQRGKLAVAHIDTRSQAIEAIQSGIDGIVHSCGNELFSEADVALAKEKGIFIVPTTAVLQAFTADNSTSSLIADPLFRGLLSPSNLERLRTSFTAQTSFMNYSTLKANTLAMHRAGVPILAGSDAPNPATTHGASLHHELELLVESGLTEAEALSAATAIPAQRFNLPNQGRIAVGMRANLLLVEGDPLKDIRQTRSIARVWKDGKEIDRQPMLKRIAQEQEEARSRMAAKTRLISDFDKSISSEFGGGWSSSTDGASTCELNLADGGAKQSASSLRLRGQVQDKRWPYAGAWFAPSATRVFPADLSAYKRVTFWVKGAPARHSVMIFASSLPRSRATQKFETTEQWKQVTIPFEDFAGCDGKNVFGIWFGSHVPGEFEFQLDEVALLK